MAAGSVSAYDPLYTAFTTKSLCEALNLAAMSLTRSPATAVIACQNWISVAATEGDARPARSTVATRTLSVECFMRASIGFVGRIIRAGCVGRACVTRRVEDWRGARMGPSPAPATSNGADGFPV